jgi:Protein of unknown function (DUF1501)
VSRFKTGSRGEGSRAEGAQAMEPEMKTHGLGRRILLERLFGVGLIGLKALATGLPASVLLNPRRALADPTFGVASNPNAQYLIFSSSDAGDPLNANVPGMYANADISHSKDPAMAPTSLSIGGSSYTAALPWSTLPQAVLDRTCFFHHGTYTVVHPDINKVLRLGDELAPAQAGTTTLHPEMLPSWLCANLGPALGTVQNEPISLSPVLTYQGRPQPILRPTSLASLLASPTGALGSLQALRDKHLDQLSALYKAEGTPAQRDFLDRYANSQRQARAVSTSLLTQLQALTNDGQDNQARAAAILIAMNITPAVGIRIGFGGDNHVDTNLASETRQTVAGVGTINTLMQALASLGLSDRVTFMTLNVFGRTLTNSDNGRQHHGDHHCTVMIGKPIKGSVVGGVELYRGDYRATSIDAATGSAVASDAGTIPFHSTFAAMGKTLGKAVGADTAALGQAIVLGGKPTNGKLLPDGQAVPAALVNG